MKPTAKNHGIGRDLLDCHSLDLLAFASAVAVLQRRQHRERAVDAGDRVDGAAHQGLATSLAVGFARASAAIAGDGRPELDG